MRLGRGSAGALLRLPVQHPALGLALAALGIHVYASGGYGFFRDELYFIVCGQRPDWGYVDQPPLIPWIAAAIHGLFPGSLRMLRLLPALSHAGTIAMTGETARRLGGGRWAQALAALAVLTGPVYLAQGTLMSTDALQAPSWLFCSYAMIHVIREKDERWWLAIGAVSGLALLSKYMIAFWLAALGVGLLATPARRSLAHPSIYLGMALGTLIVLPNLLWQWAHDWPFLEIGLRAAETKNVALRRSNSCMPRCARPTSRRHRCGSRAWPRLPSGRAGATCVSSQSPSSC